MTNEASARSTEAFVEHLLGVVNAGMLSLMISVGEKTGLFDAMASLPPSSSLEIANAAGLDERYVREWLGAVSAGGIVVHDPDALTFALPPERAAALNRVIGPAVLARLNRHVIMLAPSVDLVVECFRNGGGVRYEDLPGAVPADSVPEVPQLTASEALVDAFLLDDVLPLVPGVLERLEHGIDVVDVGCGWGHRVNVMAAAFPKSRFLGFDLYDDSGLAYARAEASQHGLSNVRFEKRDAAALDVSDQFDFVTTFDAIHDQVRPDLALAGIARSLRPQGVYLCVDVSGSSTLADNLADPLGVFKYAWSVLYCTTVSLAYGGMGLGSMWGERAARDMMLEAGFAAVETKHLPGDLINCYHIAKVA